MSRLPILALTPGEPAGIGPDLALSQLNARDDFHLVLIADPGLLQQRAALCGRMFDLPTWTGKPSPDARCYVLPVALTTPATAGRLDPANARYVINTLDRAVQGCIQGEFDALVTGPVHKGVINDAGMPFSGHTEYLAEKTGAKQVVMLLMSGGEYLDRSQLPASRDTSASLRVGRSQLPASRDTSASLRVGRSQLPASRDTSASLRVALVTTHVPLADVAAAITRDRLMAVITTLRAELQAKFHIPNPRILVCGLNPHAGEGGHLGREEREIIQPVLEELNSAGYDVRGPIPADTAFIPRQLADTDAVLAMYHDQGLPALKALGFGQIVNITLGLPFIRTSVDHGTALDLAAAKGTLDTGSLQAALALASHLTRP